MAITRWVLGACDRCEYLNFVTQVEGKALCGICKLYPESRKSAAEIRRERRSEALWRAFYWLLVGAASSAAAWMIWR